MPSLNDEEQDERQRHERHEHRQARRSRRTATTRACAAGRRGVMRPPRLVGGMRRRHDGRRDARSRVMLQISRRDSALTTSVMMNSTRPISISAFRCSSAVGLGELVGDDRGHRVLRREQRRRDPRVVADHHRHGHRLAERAAEAEHDGADDAGARVEERDRGRFPPRRAERIRALTLRARHRLQHLARDRRRERNDHDRRGSRPADSMPTPSGGPLKSGSARSPVGQRRLERANRRHEHEDAPQAVDDRRNRREQLGQEDERLPQPVRAELGDEDRDAERDRRRDEQRQDRRVERAPDERQRAELAGDRIPDLRAPEVEAELAGSTASTAASDSNADARTR